VYYPRLDRSNIRDLGLVVTSRIHFFSEEKTPYDSITEMVEPGGLEYHVTNTCREGRYRIRNPFSRTHVA